MSCSQPACDGQASNTTRIAATERMGGTSTALVARPPLHLSGATLGKLIHHRISLSLRARPYLVMFASARRRRTANFLDKFHASWPDII